MITSRIPEAKLAHTQKKHGMENHIQTDVFPMRNMDKSKKLELWQGPLPYTKCDSCNKFKTDMPTSCPGCRVNSHKRHRYDHTCSRGRCECVNTIADLDDFNYATLFHDDAVVPDAVPAAEPASPKPPDAAELLDHLYNYSRPPGWQIRTDTWRDPEIVRERQQQNEQLQLQGELLSVDDIARFFNGGEPDVN